MRWPAFAGPTFLRGQSRLASPERCLNLYSQRRQTARGVDYALYPWPGITSFATPTGSPGRGIVSQTMSGAEKCYAVIGPTLYEISSDGVATSRGTVAVDGNPATLVMNGDGGDELFVTSGDTGYILDVVTNTFTSPAVADVTFGGMMDGYFVALDAPTSTFKISPLLNGSAAWDSTQILQRSTAPDPWLSMLVKYPRIWLLGEHSGDVLYNAGTSPFPFAPIRGVQIPYGIAAPFSLKQVGPAILWLTHTNAGDGQVVEALGYAPTVVSTEPVEYQWSTYARIDDAVAWTFQDQGNEWYVLNFPTANRTWAYNRTSGLWNEVGSVNTTTGAQEVWGPQYHTHVFDKHLVLHAGNGTIYRLGSDLFTNSDGAGLVRLRVPSPLDREQKRVFVDRLQLKAEAGIGLATGQGTTPYVLMRMSRDGGYSLGNQRQRSAGVLGDYDARLIWHNCGAGRNPVPEFRASDPVGHRWLDLLADVRVGAA